MAIVSLGQNRRAREPPLFSLFFPKKTAGRPAKAAEFLGSYQSRRPNNSEEQRAITAKKQRITATQEQQITAPTFRTCKQTPRHHFSALTVDITTLRRFSDPTPLFTLLMINYAGSTPTGLFGALHPPDSSQIIGLLKRPRIGQVAASDECETAINTGSDR